MASSEMNVISGSVGRREEYYRSIRLYLELGVLFPFCFPPSSPSLLYNQCQAPFYVLGI